MKVLFWIAIVVMGWLGLRNLITMVLGVSLDGPLKKGQGLCHFIVLVVYWGAAIFAIVDRSWWPIIIGSAGAYLFRWAVIRSGEIVAAAEEDREDFPADM